VLIPNARKSNLRSCRKRAAGTDREMVASAGEAAIATTCDRLSMLSGSDEHAPEALSTGVRDDLPLVRHATTPEFDTR
jgi:hypothetical protein